MGKFWHRVEFLRVILFILNIVFVLVGIAIIGIGIYIQTNNNFSVILNRLADTGNFEGQSLGFLAFVLIGGGVFTVLIAIVGCMGYLWNNRILLYIYSIILTILMIVELVGFIMAFAYKGSLESVYRKNLYEVLITALNKSDRKVLDAFTDLEKSLQCCGVNGLDDYHGREPKNPDCFRYRKKGCSPIIIELLNKSLPTIGGTLGAVLLLELLGLIVAIKLAIALKNAPETNYSSFGNFFNSVVPNRRQNYDSFQ